MGSNPQKLKLLYLMQMMSEETDAEQGLTMGQILERLEALGIHAERKSVYRDIETLRDFGFDIRSYQRAPVEYALGERDFALSELELLIDTIQSTRFLTQRKSDSLVRSVKKLASANQRKLLDKRVHVNGRIKMQNESVFSNVDRIHEAITRRKKVTFLYFKYDADKQKVYQRDGERYEENPVHLVYSDGYYYLVAYNEKHESFPNYRVDRMDRIQISDEPMCRNERIANFSVEDLAEHAFGMYSGDKVNVTLLVEEEVMSSVIDRFGKDIHAFRVNDHQARVVVPVMKSRVFFGWLAQFGTSIRIEKPSKLAQEFVEYLREITEGYETDDEADALA